MCESSSERCMGSSCYLRAADTISFVTGELGRVSTGDVTLSIVMALSVQLKTLYSTWLL